ncbi:MAG: porin [Betaproteobacteria bacterium]
MNFKLSNLVAATLAGSMLMGFGVNAMADSTTDIVNALVSKGVLTEEEGALLTKGREGEQDAAAAKKLTTPSVKEKDGAFSLASGDGKNSIALTGRLHFDARASDMNDFGGATADTAYPYSADTDTKSVGDHFKVRRARIGVKGRIGGIADYLLQGNITGSNTLDEAYLDVNKYEPLGLKFGKFKVPYGLEQQTSSNNIDFIERSYVDQNAPAKKMGAMLHGEVKGFTYQGSVFQNNDDAQSQRDDNISYAGRLTTNLAEFMGNKDAVLHLGLAGYNSEYELTPTTSSNTSKAPSGTTKATMFAFTSGGGGLQNAMRAQIGGESLGSAGTAYNTASPSTAKVENHAAALEGIAAYNNFKLQGEYSSAFYKGTSAAPGKLDTIQADVDTWYAEALWIITGEKYADFYKKGAFGSLKPKSEFNMDTGTGYGLWELGFRVDAFDVGNTSLVQNTGSSDRTRFQGPLSTINDSAVSCISKSAGSTACNGVKAGATSYTGGIKWVWNPNMMFKASYTHTKFDHAFAPMDVGDSATGGRTTDTLKMIDHENILMVRGQYSF